MYALAWVDVITERGNAEGETNVLEWIYVLYTVHTDNLK